MIVQELVDKTVKRLYPEEYHPRPDGPVRAVICASQEEIYEMAKAYSHEPDDTGFFSIRGLTLRVGFVFQEMLPGPETDKKWGGAHIVLVNEEIETAEELAFALLHELGHVDWYTKKSLDRGIFTEEEQEVYADFFAFDSMSNLLGMDKAVTILTTVGVTKGGLLDQ